MDPSIIIVRPDTIWYLIVNTEISQIPSENDTWRAPLCKGEGEFIENIYIYRTICMLSDAYCHLSWSTITVKISSHLDFSSQILEVFSFLEFSWDESKTEL